MLLAIALLALSTGPAEAPAGCDLKSPLRDPEVCEPLYDDGTYLIYNMESVAVGSVTEIKRVREMTQHCDVSNRIDYVGQVDIAVYDIVNANKQSRDCVRGWIELNAPELKYSEESFQKKFQDAPLLLDNEDS